MSPRGTTQFVAAASTLIEAMSVAMPPTAARKAAINTLIKSLQDAGIWNLLDVMWVLAAHSPQASLLNWKSPGTFTPTQSNSPTWTADRGWAGNGSNASLQTGWTPSTNAVNYALNNASAWHWVTNDVAGGAADLGVSSDAAANRVQINPRTAGNLLSSIINASSNNTSAIATSVGLSGTQRTASTVTTNWKNGVSQNVGAAAATALPTSDVWLCAVNPSGSFSTRQIAFAAFGASLAGLELTLYNSVLTYMQTVGAA